MIRSTPSSRARAAASLPRIPQSTDTISETPFAVQPVDRRRLQAVAVPQALGDEVHDVAAEHLERAAQDDRRGDAVDVVVAVDRDPLAPREGALEPLDRAAHVGEPEGIVQVLERGVQEAAGALGVAEAAQAQQPGDTGVQAERRRERGRLLVVARQVMPDEGLVMARARGLRYNQRQPTRARSCARGAALVSVSVNDVPSSPIRRNLS